MSKQHAFITTEERDLAVKEWPLFRQKVLQRKDPSKKDLEIFIDILADVTDIEGMALLLKIMMTISASTAACERGFSSMNNEKTDLRTRLNNETFDDILRININGKPFEDFNPKQHVQSWLQTKGTHHLKGHSKPTKRTREQEEVTGAKKSKV